MSRHAVPATELMDSPEVRRAGAGLLSLALLDARNHTLMLLSLFGEALAQAPADASSWPLVEPPLWTAGHAGWFQERWIARNPQRNQGPRCDLSAARLGAREAQADTWWDPTQSEPGERWQLALPGLEQVKATLLDGIEDTTALLEKAGEGDDALYFFRLALLHEDRCCEQLVRAAQALGVPLKLTAGQAPAPLAPLALPATRWTLGVPARRGGFVFDVEAGEHAVDVPDSEIDAQCVTWAQFNEFVDDGGYDRPELWQPAGWDWLQRLAVAEGRRGPRYVQQIGSASGAVLQTRFGRAQRFTGPQPVMHVSWWEADAWCRWAGRRLPTEVEWEMAAEVAAHRGFRWGEVTEWTAGTLRPYPDHHPLPGQDAARPLFGRAKVLRGASFATRPRLRYTRVRQGAMPDDDTGFTGFRSCAV